MYADNLPAIQNLATEVLDSHEQTFASLCMVGIMNPDDSYYNLAAAENESRLYSVNQILMMNDLL